APELIEQLISAVNKCSRRAKAWRAPPNWSAYDWNRELEAQAAAAALRAELQYDYSRQVSMKVFLNSRVIADLLTRYRQEWRYSLRFPPFTALVGGEPAHNRDFFEVLSTPDQEPHELDGSYSDLQAALTRLPHIGRQLIEQLFWRDSKE